MIINSFDLSEPIIKVSDVYPIEPFISDICIVSFSRMIKQQVVSQYDMKKVSEVTTANSVIDIYAFELDCKKYLYYLSPITAPAASVILYEVAYKLQVKKFIVFGSCGVLNVKAFGKLIVPTESYRDEGVSYHYMEPTDYIKMENADKLASIFNDIKVDYIAGRNWCTDAIYMETKNKVEARKNEGCNSVEMESSALQAVCNYAKLDLYMFFFTSDLVSSDGWQNDSLGTKKEEKHQRNSFDVAIELAKRI